MTHGQAGLGFMATALTETRRAGRQEIVSFLEWAIAFILRQLKAEHLFI
jgi:hypothetical protein